MLPLLFIYLIIFIALLFACQLIFFEIARHQAIKMNNYAWFSTLNKSFSYTRTGSMIFICVICYLFSAPSGLTTLEWFMYLLLFIASGVVADAITQFLVLKYGKFRCRKQINIADDLESEFSSIKNDNIEDDESYEVSLPKYDEISITKKYLKPTDHLAFMSVDQGEFVKSFKEYPESTFDVEPYSNTTDVQLNLKDLPVRATKFTENNQMPFKDNRIDIIMDEYSNYDKAEISRVLKQGGYFIVNQYGSNNLREFLQMYMPAIKGKWDLESCQETLRNAGFKIIEGFEDYGYLRFRTLRQLHTYLKKAVPDAKNNPERYKVFYLHALKEIKENKFFDMTSHRFLVVAQKL